ncbi:hypothetical protein BC831DRAFT_51681 [Entophlyctis helioformis]|nr:hypothetical protein BC831DRAFT_51681 [Entophlyctis helioformis]
MMPLTAQQTGGAAVVSSSEQSSSVPLAAPDPLAQRNPPHQPVAASRAFRFAAVLPNGLVWTPSVSQVPAGAMTSGSSPQPAQGAAQRQPDLHQTALHTTTGHAWNAIPASALVTVGGGGSYPRRIGTVAHTNFGASIGSVAASNSSHEHNQFGWFGGRFGPAAYAASSSSTPVSSFTHILGVSTESGGGSGSLLAGGPSRSGSRRNSACAPGSASRAPPASSNAHHLGSQLANTNAASQLLYGHHANPYHLQQAGTSAGSVLGPASRSTYHRAFGSVPGASGASGAFGSFAGDAGAANAGHLQHAPTIMGTNNASATVAAAETTRLHLQTLLSPTPTNTGDLVTGGAGNRSSHGLTNHSHSNRQDEELDRDDDTGEYTDPNHVQQDDPDEREQSDDDNDDDQDNDQEDPDEPMDVEEISGSDRENWVDVDEDIEGDLEGSEADMSDDDEADGDYDDDVLMDHSHGAHPQTQASDDARRKEQEASDQQAELRKQIMVIQSDSSLSGADKAKRIQDLMTKRWATKQQKESSKEVRYINRLANKKKDFSIVTDDDRVKTFHASGILGCKHYQRSAKLQAHCCGKWDTCRFCHDEVSDHTITRNLVTTMMCMYCSTVQSAGQDCINPECGKRVARYYCKECKLWDDDPRKNIYHCYDCGICRIGKGLGIDYFHCPTCNVCMAIGLKGRHKCIERNLESDCPICGEYMFTSTSTVIFMPCGHCMHHKCHQQYIQTSYQCPTCLKSLADMTDYFRRIDGALAQHQMPPEYNDTYSYTYCNDCEKKSYAKFHFIYHKCAFCRGYNTKLLQTRIGLPPDAAIARDPPPAPVVAAAPAPAAATGPAPGSAPPTQATGHGGAGAGATVGSTLVLDATQPNAPGSATGSHAAAVLSSGSASGAGSASGLAPSSAALAQPGQLLQHQQQSRQQQHELHQGSQTIQPAQLGYHPTQPHALQAQQLLHAQHNVQPPPGLDQVETSQASSSDQDSLSHPGQSQSSGSSSTDQRSFWCHRCQVRC